MTASRARRRGPSPSPDSGAREPRYETRAAEQEVRAADDDADRFRPTGAAGTPAPDARAPASPVDSAPSEVPGPPGAHASFGATASRATPSVPLRAAHVLRTTVAAHPSRAPGVRAMVAEHLVRLRLPSERVDDVVLATGELFVNAIEHGSPGRGDTVTVTVECGRRELRVSVADRSSVLPGRRTGGGPEASGRGLTIIAALTDDWGVAPADPGTRGKKVWFSMLLQGEP